MAHQIKSPTNKNKKSTLEKELEDKGMTLAQAETVLLDAADIGEKMIAKANRVIKLITDQNKNRWKDLFNENAILVRWFGKVDNKSQVKKVRNRMDSICSRFERGLNIRFRPQKERTHYAHNRGTFFEPSTFKVFPLLLDGDEIFIASTFIHELVHVWFKDQKLGSETVYGRQPALDLAKYHAKRARKSAENFAFFCEDIWGYN